MSIYDAIKYKEIGNVYFDILGKNVDVKAGIYDSNDASPQLYVKFPVIFNDETHIVEECIWIEKLDELIEMLQVLKKRR